MTIVRSPTSIADPGSLRTLVDRLFDDRTFWPLWRSDGGRELGPALDLYSTPEAVIAKVALPGVKPDDVDVTMGDDIVTIRATYHDERKQDESGYVLKELSQGTLTRTFAIPYPVKSDAAKAEFKDGLLTLTLPRTEAVTPTHIKVEAG